MSKFLAPYKIWSFVVFQFLKLLRYEIFFIFFVILCCQSRPSWYQAPNSNPELQNKSLMCYCTYDEEAEEKEWYGQDEGGDGSQVQPAKSRIFIKLIKYVY